LPDRPSPKSPFMKPYHILGDLSTGKTTENVANIINKSIMEGVYAYLS
jgi:hypothetical protein